MVSLISDPSTPLYPLGAIAEFSFKLDFDGVVLVFMFNWLYGGDFFLLVSSWAVEVATVAGNPVITYLRIGKTARWAMFIVCDVMAI